MVSGSLALLYFLLGFHGDRQGSGPDRGRSPVEWGDFPSGLAGWASGLAGWPRGGDGWMDRRTNRRMYNQKIALFYRTLSLLTAQEPNIPLI